MKGKMHKHFIGSSTWKVFILALMFILNLTSSVFRVTQGAASNVLPDIKYYRLPESELKSDNNLQPLGNFFRPDLAREIYQSLTGEWGLEYDPGDIGLDEGWFKNPRFSRKINVPFCLESEASGIHDLNPPSIVWYSKEFKLKLPLREGRVLLHFGAVDYKAMVWLNEKFLGDHSGGYTPFSFDVTSFLKNGSNLLAVRVEDTNDLALPRGKQSILGFPISIFYETVTGIWQPVWLEMAGDVYLKGYKVYADPSDNKVKILFRLAGSDGLITIKATATSAEGIRSTATARVKKSNSESEVELFLNFPRLQAWSPENPNLYHLAIEIERGRSVDKVLGYFGVRRVEIIDGVIFMNGKPFYHKMTLNQGFYDKGHYTADEPSLYRKDVELVKLFGFNGIRMHVKCEDPRFYFWCDYLGCVVMQDMPSAYIFCDRMKTALEKEWHEIIDRNYNHPCITTWIPFNESWGVSFIIPVILSAECKDFVKYIYRRTKEWDPSRLVIDNSGYDHTEETDIIDVHHYIEDINTCRALYDQLKDLYNYSWCWIRILSLEKFWSLNVLCWGEKYRGQPIMITEYGVSSDAAGGGSAFVESYRKQTQLILEQPHIQGFCFTQFNDGGTEAGGLVRLDRTLKVNPEDIYRINNP